MYSGLITMGHDVSLLGVTPRSPYRNPRHRPHKGHRFCRGREHAAQHSQRIGDNDLAVHSAALLQGRHVRQRDQDLPNIL